MGSSPDLDRVQRIIGSCREWIDAKHDRCNAPSEYVLWGKMIDKEGLGPRCYDHAAKWVGHHALSPNSGYALIRLDDLAALEEQHEPAPETEGR